MSDGTFSAVIMSNGFKYTIDNGDYWTVHEAGCEWVEFFSRGELVRVNPAFVGSWINRASK